MCSVVSYFVICTVVVMFSLFSAVYNYVLYFKICCEMNENILTAFGRREKLTNYNQVLLMWNSAKRCQGIVQGAAKKQPPTKISLFSE